MPSTRPTPAVRAAALAGLACIVLAGCGVVGGKKDEPAAAAADPAVQGKLDPALTELVTAYERGDNVPVWFQNVRGEVKFGDRQAAVEVVVVEASRVAAVRDRIVDLGGRVTSRFENRVWATLPVPALRALAGEDAVRSMSVLRAGGPVRASGEKRR